MRLFKRNKKETTNEFAQEQYISGGNLYEIKQKMKAQQQIDFNNLTDIDDLGYLKDFEIQDFFLLQLQANYFVNTINYEIDDADLFSKIKQMIRCAFINGKAALVKDDEKWRTYYIAKTNKNGYGDITSIDVIPWDNMQDLKTYDDVKNYQGATIPVKKDFVIFKWGSYGLSAWLYIWPFIKYQNNLLTMIQTDSFSYIKKFIYNVVDPTQTQAEMKRWFSPRTPFIIKNKNIDISNKFKTEDIAGAHNVQNDIVEMYKKICGVYYSIFGRRYNNDFKKERSITQESELTNDNYDILEKDWMDEFKIFMMKFNELSDTKIRLVERKKEQEQEQQEEGENEI